MNKVVIFGEGKIADQAYFYLTNDSPYEIVAFTVDREYLTKKELFGLPVVPFEEITQKYPPHEYKMFVAMGYQKLNKLRASKYYEAKEKGYELISYVSSKAGNFGNIEMGDNCFVLDNSTLQPCSKIGNNVTIWSNNILGHHSTIEDHCYIAGHVAIAGHTTIGKYSFIGVNATIGHEIIIGEENLIGASSIITKSTEAKSVFIVQETPKFRLDSSTFVKMTKL
jgi:sugar O-acyltransferase (sialic acid O-acetyltransferase NeuD family)